jgi:hypothetical protein
MESGPRAVESRMFGEVTCMASSNRALCVLNWPGSPEFETIGLRMFRGENISNRFTAGWLTCWMNISIWKGCGIMWPAKNCRATIASRGCEGEQLSRPKTGIKVLIETWRATLRRSRGGNRDLECRVADFSPQRIGVGRRTLRGAAKC